MGFISLLSSLVVGGFIGVATVHLAFRVPYIRNQIISYLNAISQEHADHLLSKVKEKIPMAEVFLQGALEEQLKQWLGEELEIALSQIHSKLLLPSVLFGAIIGFFTHVLTL